MSFEYFCLFSSALMLRRPRFHPSLMMSMLKRFHYYNFSTTFGIVFLTNCIPASFHYTFCVINIRYSKLGYKTQYDLTYLVRFILLLYWEPLEIFDLIIQKMFPANHIFYPTRSTVGKLHWFDYFGYLKIADVLHGIEPSSICHILTTYIFSCSCKPNYFNFIILFTQLKISNSLLQLQQNLCW